MLPRIIFLHLQEVQEKRSYLPGVTHTLAAVCVLLTLLLSAVIAVLIVFTMKPAAPVQQQHDGPTEILHLTNEGTTVNMENYTPKYLIQVNPTTDSGGGLQAAIWLKNW